MKEYIFLVNFHNMSEIPTSNNFNLFFYDCKIKKKWEKKFW